MAADKNFNPCLTNQQLAYLKIQNFQIFQSTFCQHRLLKLTLDNDIGDDSNHGNNDDNGDSDDNNDDNNDDNDNDNDNDNNNDIDENALSRPATKFSEYFRPENYS